MYIPDVYVPYGSWTQYYGDTYTNKNTGENGWMYEFIKEYPVFEGQWIIDESNSTELGKKYLSNVLVDANI